MSNEKVKLPTVSYSKVTSYKSCPKKYKLSYIDKLPRAPSIYADFGNFCHEILEKFHSNFMAAPPSATEMKVLMVKLFNEKIKEYEKKLSKEQIDEGYEIMKLYLKQILDNTKNNSFPNIVAVERKIWEPMNNELNFIGYIDRLQKDEDGIFHVMDYKTTKNKKYLKDRTQLMLYAYFTYLKNPKVDKIRSSFILLRHKMGLLTEEHSIAELIDTKDNFIKSWQEIKEEKLFRANPRYDTCTICDYADRCAEGQELMQRKKTFYGEEARW